MNSSDKCNNELKAAIARVKAAPAAATFNDLVDVAGLDPARDFRFADLAGADFRGSNLRGFDFTGARLQGAQFQGALIGPGPNVQGVKTSGAILRQVWLGELRYNTERDRHLPAELATPVANLRTAADWSAYAASRNSSAPAEPISDATLGTGAIFSDTPGLAPEMVVVPSGSFVMGESGNQVETSLPTPFAIGRFALTFAEWDAAQAHPDWKTYSGIAPRKAKDHGWGRGKRPAIDVSWDDAKAYCAWLSKVTSKTYRLPSEAEWEYCCRAGTSTEFWWGDEISTEQANYNGNYTIGKGKKGEFRKRAVPVDSFEPNPWGLYQVHGNVWEWCEDQYNASSSSRVLRGGSWINLPGGLRSALRNVYRPDGRDSGIGFRLARTL